MARAERMLRDEQIAHEVETYNELIPEPGRAVGARSSSSSPTDAALREWLPKLVGIETDGRAAPRRRRRRPSRCGAGSTPTTRSSSPATRSPRPCTTSTSTSTPTRSRPSPPGPWRLARRPPGVPARHRAHRRTPGLSCSATSAADPRASPGRRPIRRIAAVWTGRADSSRRPDLTPLPRTGEPSISR